MVVVAAATALMTVLVDVVRLPVAVVAGLGAVVLVAVAGAVVAGGAGRAAVAAVTIIVVLRVIRSAVDRASAAAPEALVEAADAVDPSMSSVAVAVIGASCSGHGHQGSKQHQLKRKT